MWITISIKLATLITDTCSPGLSALRFKGNLQKGRFLGNTTVAVPAVHPFMLSVLSQTPLCPGMPSASANQVAEGPWSFVTFLIPFAVTFMGLFIISPRFICSLPSCPSRRIFFQVLEVKKRISPPAMYDYAGTTCHQPVFRHARRPSATSGL